MLVIAFAASLIPSVALYLWLRGIKGDDQGYRAACRRALILGFLAVIPIVGFGIVFTVTGNLLGVSKLGEVPAETYKTFTVIVLSEELVKLLALRKLLKEHPDGRSWLDVTVLMSIIGLGFGLIEDIPYGLSTNAGQMLIRGITMGHVGYGYLMGRLYGKSLKTGNRAWAVLGFVLPYLMHGFYDFGLQEEIDLAFNGNFGVLTVLLAVVDLILAISLIIHVRKARKNPTYTSPLPGFERAVVEDAADPTPAAL